MMDGLNGKNGDTMADMVEEIRLPGWFVKIMVTLLVTVLSCAFFAGETYFTIQSLARRLDLMAGRLDRIEQRLVALEEKVK